MKNLLYFFGLLLLLTSCKGKRKNTPQQHKPTGDTLSVNYAKGFSIVDYDGYKIVKVSHPFPKSKDTFTYLLVEDKSKVPSHLSYDEKIDIPIHKIIVTSTTHIPSLVSLDEGNTLVGFPHLDFISSPKIRKRIAQHQVADIGANKHLNTEIVLSLQPDVVVGFSMNANNKTYNIISKSGIPVVYDGDWNEQNPLGKAEWIKFFGAFYNKEKKATALFRKIEKSYRKAKKLAQTAKTKPTVLTGVMFKDVWNVPKGDSWSAQFIADAHADYLFKDTRGTGALALSIESVLDKARHADFWISVGSYTRYSELQNASPHYQEFDAFKNQKIYTYALTKGKKGGFAYFELAPNRPDLVLKDLIHIFHPDLLPHYQNTFFKPLQ